MVNMWTKLKSSYVLQSCIFLFLASFLALQASAMDEELTNAAGDIIEGKDVAEILNLYGGDFTEIGDFNRGRRGSHHAKIGCPKIASILEEFYTWCRTKLGGIQLTKLVGGYYFFYTDATGPRLNWYQAREWCSARGMQLADLETLAESDAVIKEIGKILTAETGVENNSFFWTGGSDLASPGIFHWLSGSLLTYTNWESGQPDNGGNPVTQRNEDCLDIIKRSSGIHWNDRSCTTAGRFVCEVTNPCKDLFQKILSLKHNSGSKKSNSRSKDSNSRSKDSYSLSKDSNSRSKDSNSRSRDSYSVSKDSKSRSKNTDSRSKASYSLSKDSNSRSQDSNSRSSYSDSYPHESSSYSFDSSTSYRLAAE